MMNRGSICVTGVGSYFNTYLSCVKKFELNLLLKSINRESWLLSSNKSQHHERVTTCLNEL